MQIRMNVFNVLNVLNALHVMSVLLDLNVLELLDLLEYSVHAEGIPSLKYICQVEKMQKGSKLASRSLDCEMYYN